MIRAALKSVLARKLRLLTSGLAIVLGVAFVVGTLMFSDTLSRSFTALFASTVGDVTVQPEGGGQQAGGATSTLTVPGSLVSRLAELPGAARADGQVGVEGVYVLDKDDQKPLGGFGPPSLGGNWSDAPAANGLEGLQIEQGHEPRGPDDVVLDEKTYEKAGYSLGDTVRLVTTADESNVEATLVGVAGFADGGSLNGATLAMFTTPRAQELFLDGKDAFSTIWVTAADGVSQDELRDQVESVLPDGLEAETGDDAAEAAADDLLEAISFLTTFLLIFAGIALVVGTFLIVNTFSILVAQRSRELALLRALGASRRQVLGSVMLEAGVVGVVGSTLGLGLGVLLTLGLRAFFAQVGLDLSGQPLVFAPRTFVAAYAVGVLVTGAAALLPALRTLRIAPVQAMRDDVALPESSLRTRFRGGLLLALLGGASLFVGLTDVVDVGGGGWFTGLGILAVLLGVTAMNPVICQPFLALARRFYAAVAGAVGNLAGRNALRNPRRTTATASALMIGLTLACTMAMIGDSAKASVDKSVEESFVGDYVVSSVFGGSFSSSVATKVAQVPGVDDVVQQRFGFAEDADGGFAGVLATGPGALDRLDVTFASGSGSALEEPGTVVVGTSVARSQGVGVGDTVELSVPTGTVRWKVVGVFESTALLSSGYVTSTDTLTSAGYPDRDYLLVVFAAPGATGMQDRLDDALADQKIVTVLDQQAYAAQQREPIDLFVRTIYALLGLALVIAVLGIVNTLALSVIERTREVGLLRAVGLTRGQLRAMITLESIVISLLGAVLGVVLGVGFGFAILHAVRDEGLDVISVPTSQLAAFLAASVVIGVLAAFLPSRRAARLDVLEAIATE